MRGPRAPRWASRILRFLLGPDWGLDLRAELEDEYVRRSDEHGPRRADAWYFGQILSPSTLRLARALRVRRARTERAGHVAVMSWQHVRHAVRELGRRPGLSAAVVLALSLGIGANTAIFSVVEAVVLRPLPYPDADRLVSVWGVVDREGRSELSGPEFAALEAEVDVFEVLAQVKGEVNAALEVDSGRPERFQVLTVSWDYFDLYGIPAALGRTFREEDDILLPPSMISDPDSNWPILKMVLSHDMWVTRFASDSDVIGTVVTVNGRRREIIGVMPEGYRALGPSAWGESGSYMAWYLSAYDPTQFPRDTRFVRVLGRLKAGVSPDDAARALDRFSASQRATEPIASRDQWGLGIAPLSERVSENARQPLFLLLGAVAFVLLIATANVATLLLARSVERLDDLRLRRALGATRAHLVAIAMTESLFLAVGGTLIAVGLASWGTRALMALRPAEMMRVEDVGLSAPVLLFTIALGFLTALLGGLIPAWWGTRRAAEEGRLVGHRDSGRVAFRRLGAGLVAIEIALALVLTVGTGLLVRSFSSLTNTDPGFALEHTRTARVNLTNTSHPTAEERAAFYRSVTEVLSARRGIRAAGAIAEVPLDYWQDAPATISEGRVEPLRLEISAHRVVPGALETLEVPLLAGRFLDWSDMSDPDRLVAVVDESFAVAGWPDGDAIGRTFEVTRRDYRDDVVVDVSTDVEVIGVASTVQTRSLRTPGPPTAWISMYMNTAGDYAVLARGIDATPTADLIRSAIQEVDPRLVVFDVSTMSAMARDELAELRFTLGLVGVFGLLGLVLSTVGVYGLLAYVVEQRQTELHIRAALGANGRALVRLLLSDALSIVGGGVMLGWIASWVMTRFLRSLLHGVSGTDPLTFLGVAVVLALVALLAALIPSRRAGLADPTRAIRDA